MLYDPIFYDIACSLEDAGVMTEQQRKDFLASLERRADERFKMMVEAHRNAPDTRTRMEKIMGVRR